jgi:hypothetical protein
MCFVLSRGDEAAEFVASDMSEGRRRDTAWTNTSADVLSPRYICPQALRRNCSCWLSCRIYILLLFTGTDCLRPVSSPRLAGSIERASKAMVWRLEEVVAVDAGVGGCWRKVLGFGMAKEDSVFWAPGSV